MAKFRRGHGAETRREGKPNMMGRTIVLIIILAGMLLITVFLIKHQYFNRGHSKPPGDEIFFSHGGTDIIEPQERFFLPVSPDGNVSHYSYYSISCKEKCSQINWLAYILTMDNFSREKTENHSRDSSKKTLPSQDLESQFRTDGFINTSLIPAEFMSFNELAAKENSIDSNMILMHKDLKNGSWKQLTENIRNWTSERQKLYVVTGTIENVPQKLLSNNNQTIVPNQIYALILDIHSDSNKGIAFILPNGKNETALYDNAVSIDSIEMLTGVHFFRDLMTTEELSKLKTSFDLRDWKPSK